MTEPEGASRRAASGSGDGGGSDVAQLFDEAGASTTGRDGVTTGDSSAARVDLDGLFGDPEPSGSAPRSGFGERSGAGAPSVAEPAPPTVARDSRTARPDVARLFEPGRTDDGEALAAPRSGAAGEVPAAAGPAEAATSAEVAPASPLEQLRQVRPPRSRWWSIGYPVVIALVVVAIPVLLYLGKETILDSTDGKVVAVVDDPRAPGYEALVEPTDTMLVVDEADDGTLSAATVLALSGPTSGGLVSIPPDTVMVAEDGRPVALAAAYADGGAEAVRSLVEGQMGAAMGEVEVVTADEWADLVAPVGPLVVDNPDDVVATEADGSQQVAFDAGEISVAPDQVGSFLSTRSPGDSDLNRMVRQQRFWAAWLRAVATAGDDPAVVPGEVDSGLGRFVRTLAATQVELQTLPVQRVPLPGAETSVFDPLEDQIVPLVARLVPFPVGAPPGARLTVRVLDGTGRLQQGLPAAPLLVLGGGEIAAVGNASTFDRSTTQITYLDEAQRPAVQALRDALGVGELVKGTEATDVVDVTVVLGADAEAALAGATTMTTSTLAPVPVTGSEP